MLRDFYRRYLWMCLAGLAAGAAAFALLSGWKAAAAFAASFALVAVDFLWIALTLGRVLGRAEPGRGAGWAFALGFLLKTLLLLLVLYGILRFLPGESLAVIAGIGGPLMLLALAGAIRTRG